MKEATDTVLYQKALGCLLGGIIGDAVGTPCENKDFRWIEQHLGWVDDFSGDGTDDTAMKDVLADALARTDGQATIDDWARQWLDDWEGLFGSKLNKYFISVVHTAQKLKRHSTPRMAALGNMPSSSSAMCISPVGIVNAGNPRAAALQTYNLAALIHIHDVGFCQDAAVAMAAGVAEACRPEATVQSVVEASTAHVLPRSGAEMLAAIERALELAREQGAYKPFRQAVYDQAERFFCPITCDSRETVPLTLALFVLADGDVERCVTYGANFGRDADTIASMCGALAGALRGADGVKPAWRERVRQHASRDQAQLALSLVETARRKAAAARDALAAFERVAG
jgi:ADP-ribosylglycohydrolase